MKTVAASLGLILLTCIPLAADTSGFFEQKFSAIFFEKGKWTRTTELPCYSYRANADGATVEVLRIGSANLVHFKGVKGITVTVCGSTAAFDEGFEAGSAQQAPYPNRGEK